MKCGFVTALCHIQSVCLTKCHFFWRVGLLFLFWCSMVCLILAYQTQNCNGYACSSEKDLFADTVSFLPPCNQYLNEH